MDKMINNNIMKFEGNDVEVFEWNGKVLFNPKHVAKCLEISDVNSSVRNFNERQLVRVTNSKIKGINFRKLNNRGENFLTESGVYKLISEARNCSSDKKHNLLKTLLPNKEFFILKDRKEPNFIEMLEEVLNPLDIIGIRQYSVLNYKIDYYIPNLKLAIEYDENDHKGYTYEEQEGRQKEIEKILGCNFIRLSDKNSHLYNIGLVMKGVIKYGR